MSFKHCVAASALFMMLTSVVTAAEVGGKYTVAGTNFDGSKYSGTAEVTVSSNSTCHIIWHTGSNSSSKGVCMRVNDVLVAGYTMKGGSFGLVAYNIKDNGVLDGIWTIADEDGAGTDVLTPVK
jgi:hypothetical protein